MSFDFKLMFLFHGCMMILLVIGGMLSAPGVRVQRRAAICPHFTLRPTTETFRLALARCKATELAHCSRPSRLDICFPVRSDCSDIAFDFKILALVPSRAWNRNFQRPATTSIGFAFRRSVSNRLLIRETDLLRRWLLTGNLGADEVR